MGEYLRTVDIFHEAKGRKCAKCSRYGHFAAFCRGSRRPSPVRGRESRPKITSDNSRRSARQTNHVGGCSEEEIQVDDNPVFAFHVVWRKRKKFVWCQIQVSLRWM